MSAEPKPPKYPILDEIEIQQNVLENWQITADLLAEIAKVPAALVMRVHARDIEVFVTSHSTGNVYHPGEKAPLDTGLYCETVMSTRRELLVPNALKDPAWKHNPDIALGMVSYCGLPLTWPTGELFGTLCILDKQENTFDHRVHPLMERFRDSIQLSLAQVYEISLARIRRNETEDELRESENRFFQLSNSLPQLVWTCQPDGTCDFLGKQWVSYTGIPEAQQLGYGWLEQLHPDDRAPTLVAWRAAIASGDNFHVEFRIRRHDGEYRWFDTRALGLRDAHGRIVKWFGSNTDITEYKKAEALLNKQLDELERWRNVMVGREMRDIELKREVNELLKQAGQPVRYPSAENM